MCWFQGQRILSHPLLLLACSLPASNIYYQLFNLFTHYYITHTSCHNRLYFLQFCPYFYIYSITHTILLNFFSYIIQIKILQSQYFIMDTTINSHLKSLSVANQNKFDSKITNNEFLLGKFFTPKKHTCPKPYKKTKTAKLLANQLNYIKPQHKNQYQLYIPLHKLWLSYISSLLSEQHSKQSRQFKMLRSDFHGAQIQILSSKTLTYIGIKGIVVGESLKTFKIVCEKENKIKTILKVVCIFAVRANPEHAFIINGSNLVYRPTDRIKHKFKFKKAQQINHHFLSLMGAAEEEQMHN